MKLIVYTLVQKGLIPSDHVTFYKVFDVHDAYCPVPETLINIDGIYEKITLVTYDPNTTRYSVYLNDMRIVDKYGHNLRHPTEAISKEINEYIEDYKNRGWQIAKKET